jgi:hypothetical protein
VFSLADSEFPHVGLVDADKFLAEILPFRYEKPLLPRLVPDERITIVTDSRVCSSKKDKD